MILENLRFHEPRIIDGGNGRYHTFWTGAGGGKTRREIPDERIKECGLKAIKAGCASHRSSHVRLLETCADFAKTLKGPGIDIETVSDKTIWAAKDVFACYGFVLGTNNQLIPEAQDLDERPSHAASVCVQRALPIFRRYRTDI